MSMMDTIRARHSVREYDGRAPEGAALEALAAVVEQCARQSGLNIQLVLDNPEVFQVVAKFGIIHGAVSSIAFVTARGTTDDEVIGYWGQKIVLVAQEAGLNTCWVALCARRRSKAKQLAGEKVRLVIAVGYGLTQGHPRKTKTMDKLCTVECADSPAWFKVAMEAAQLAPTAVNHQNYHVTLRPDGETVRIEAPKGALNYIDLGIVKRNFEEVANETGARWCWEDA
ncbi:MAG: nitroreductase family protein [Atopobiaceae bacterium]|nr:nitroreductase family protein [Atopobiaceae bacterium]